MAVILNHYYLDLMGKQSINKSLCVCSKDSLQKEIVVPAQHILTQVTSTGTIQSLQYNASQKLQKSLKLQYATQELLNSLICKNKYISQTHTHKNKQQNYYTSVNGLTDYHFFFWHQKQKNIANYQCFRLIFQSSSNISECQL